ncbi:MAG: ABC transporter ATP-binding protein [Betaproteobacteria bacterium]|nr:ABC transporter ATP-binding protein [Betaproteobacteria bacterium]
MHSSANTGSGAISLPISIRDVRKTYGALAALDDVSLEVASGEFITLLGPSGSGKTTLLMVLAGFIRADSGQILFGDSDVSLVAPHKRNVGMVFQNYALFPHMTVAGNVAYPLKLRRVGKTEIGERVARALDLVQLSGLGERHVDQLSGGQRQRVALARAIVFEPRILLMDEPLSALDKKLREQMQIEVRHLHQRLGMTTVYVTHDQREALTMSDRIAVIDRGRFRQIGTPREIYGRPASRFIADFIGESNFLPVAVRDGQAYLGDKLLRLAEPLRTGEPSQLLGVRPEKVVILGGGDAGAHNVFEGMVREIVYQGESSLVSVTLAGGHELSVRQQAISAVIPPVVGAAVRLGLAPADTIIVPQDSPA